MEKIEYWQTSFETKLNLTDAFLSELAVKYIEQRAEKNKPETIKFTKSIYEAQQVLSMFKLILSRAELDNRNLSLKLKQANETIEQFESDETGIRSAEIQIANNNLDRSKEDKYQSQIQELEIKIDKLEKELIKKINK